MSLISSSCKTVVWTVVVLLSNSLALFGQSTTEHLETILLEDLNQFIKFQNQIFSTNEAQEAWSRCVQYFSSENLIESIDKRSNVPGVFSIPNFEALQDNSWGFRHLSQPYEVETDYENLEFPLVNFKLDAIFIRLEGEDWKLWKETWRLSCPMKVSAERDSENSQSRYFHKFLAGVNIQINQHENERGVAFSGVLLSKYFEERARSFVDSYEDLIQAIAHPTREEFGWYLDKFCKGAGVGEKLRLIKLLAGHQQGVSYDGLPNILQYLKVEYRNEDLTPPTWKACDSTKYVVFGEKDGDPKHILNNYTVGIDFIYEILSTELQYEVRVNLVYRDDLLEAISLMRNDLGPENKCLAPIKTETLSNPFFSSNPLLMFSLGLVCLLIIVGIFYGFRRTYHSSKIQVKPLTLEDLENWDPFKSLKTIEDATQKGDLSTIRMTLENFIAGCKYQKSKNQRIPNIWNEAKNHRRFIDQLEEDIRTNLVSREDSKVEASRKIRSIEAWHKLAVEELLSN